MKRIAVIYKNKFGLSFYWNQHDAPHNEIAQLVFRDMGFHLSLPEIKSFSYQVKRALKQDCCSQCKNSYQCKSLLLKTPSSKIDLAVSKEELFEIQDLLDKTILKMEIDNYLVVAAN